MARRNPPAFYIYERIGGLCYVHIFDNATHATAWIRVHDRGNAARYSTEMRGKMGRGTRDHRGEIDFAVDDERARIEFGEDDPNDVHVIKPAPRKPIVWADLEEAPF